MAAFCVGLTGGIGAGKTTVAELFAGLGAGVLDADLVGRELTCPGGAAMPELRRVFGDDYLLPDGSLDRARMRERVFADAAARARLEQVLHPLIRERLRQGLMVAQAPYVIMVVPLLYEHWAAYAPLLQRVLVVDCEASVQLARVLARSPLNAALARAMIAAQATRAQRLSLADDVIANVAEPAALTPRVAELHRQYLDLARAGPGTAAPQGGQTLP